MSTISLPIQSAAGVLLLHAPVVVPPAPSGLTAATSPAAPTSPALAWTANDGGAATAYKVERAPDVSGSPGAWAQVGTAGRFAVGYADPALAARTAYWYRVRASTQLADSAYTAPVKVWTVGVVRCMFSVDGGNLGTTSGAGDLANPMTPTVAIMQAAGFDTIQGGFFINRSENGAGDYATWQASFDNFFANLAQWVAPNGFHWLASGDDLARTQAVLDGSTQSFGPQTVAHGVQALAAQALPTGAPCCLGIEVVDEANGIVPGHPNVSAQLQTCSDLMRAATTPPVPQGWPSDIALHSTSPQLAPWQAPPLADYASFYSTANAWSIPALPNQVWSVSQGAAALLGGIAVVRGVPAQPVATDVPVSGDFGNVEANGSFTVLQGGWLPELSLMHVWVALAGGVTVLRYYVWDTVSAWNSRKNTGVLHTFQTGCTPQVNAANWAVLSTSNNLIAALEARICGTAGAAPGWGANFTTAQRTAADGGKVLWGVNVTDAAHAVPTPAPAGYTSAALLTKTGTRSDLSPAALAGSTLQSGEVALFWS